MMPSPTLALRKRCQTLISPLTMGIAIMPTANQFKRARLRLGSALSIRSR